MRDDGVACLQPAAEFLWAKLVRPRDVAGLETVAAGLGEHLGVGVRSCPVVEGPDQAVERQLRAYGCKNHLVRSN